MSADWLIGIASTIAAAAAVVSAIATVRGNHRNQDHLSDQDEALKGISRR